MTQPQFKTTSEISTVLYLTLLPGIPILIISFVFFFPVNFYFKAPSNLKVILYVAK